MNTNEQFIKILSMFVSNVNMSLVFIFVAQSVLTYLQKVKHFQLFKLDNYIIRLVKSCCKPIYLLYKVSIIFLLHINFLLSIPLIINYTFNLLAVRNLSKGRADAADINKLALNPFSQYKAMYYLTKENREEANYSYKYFSLGFWMLLPFFLFGDIGISRLFCVVMVLLWPSLIILQIIYAKQADYGKSKLKHYSPLFIQLLSINLLGSILLYISSRKSSGVITLK